MKTNKNKKINPSNISIKHDIFKSSSVFLLQELLLLEPFNIYQKSQEPLKNP